MQQRIRISRADRTKRIYGHRIGISALGLPSDFVRKKLLLLRGGDVRELAAASYPHIHCGGGDFPFIAGGVCGERRLA